MLLHGRLVSRTSGEYSGPCPFGQGGDDRFSWWPATGNWFCRHQCPQCPGVRCLGGGTKGWLKDCGLQPQDYVEPRPSTPPTMAKVREYHQALDARTLEYLATRGIRERTARRFLVGTNCHRLTIPCIVRGRCYGIKKRWIGEPPEEWIDRYTMEPGSTGHAIFNYDRLLSGRRWQRFLIVEGMLDCILLDQLGIATVAPFGGGGVWDVRWKRPFRRVLKLIIVADNDEGGQGLAYAKRKQELLGKGQVVLAPGGFKDVGEAYEHGVDIHKWLRSLPPRKGDD